MHKSKFLLLLALLAIAAFTSSGLRLPEQPLARSEVTSLSSRFREEARRKEVDEDALHLIDPMASQEGVRYARPSRREGRREEGCRGLARLGPSPQQAQAPRFQRL